MAEPPAESPSTTNSSESSGVALGAVGELTGEGAAVHRVLADDEVAGLPGGLSGALGGHALLDDAPGLVRVLFEVKFEVLHEGLLDRGLGLGVAQLAFGLAFELRFFEPDADDGGQAFADVLSAEVGGVLLLQFALLRVVVDGAGEAGAEPYEMSAAVGGVDAVGEGEGGLVEAAVVLQGDLDHCVVGVLLEVEGLALKDFAVLIELAHEAGDAALEVERPVRLGVGFGGEGDPDCLVEVGHLPEALQQGVPLVVRGAEYL